MAYLIDSYPHKRLVAGARCVLKRSLVADHGSEMIAGRLDLLTSDLIQMARKWCKPETV